MDEPRRFISIWALVSTSFEKLLKWVQRKWVTDSHGIWTKIWHSLRVTGAARSPITTIPNTVIRLEILTCHIARFNEIFANFIVYGYTFYNLGFFSGIWIHGNSCCKYEGCVRLVKNLKQQVIARRSWPLLRAYTHRFCIDRLIKYRQCVYFACRASCLVSNWMRCCFSLGYCMHYLTSRRTVIE